MKTKEPDKVWITRRYREFYKSTGMSVSRFADALGEDIERNRLYKVINGQNNVSLEVVAKTKWAFPDLNLDWLIFGVNEMLILVEEGLEEEMEIEKKRRIATIRSLETLLNVKEELIETQRIAIEVLKLMLDRKGEGD